MQTKSPTQMSLSNQSRVYEMFEEHEKLTISEITSRVNEKAKADVEKLSDRSIRRAIEQLIKSGFLKTYGKQHNATLYGPISASYLNDDQKLINFNGELLTVGEFFEVIVQPENRPLQKSKPVVSRNAEHVIRRLLAGVVYSSISPGYADFNKKSNRQLHGILAELEFTAGILRSFLDSPVWYEQYRDRIAKGVRDLQEKDPALYQLTIDYIMSKGSGEE